MMQIKRKQHMKQRKVITGAAVIIVLVAWCGYLIYAQRVGSWPFGIHPSNEQLYGSSDTNPTTDIPSSSSTQGRSDAGSITSPMGSNTEDGATVDADIKPSKPTGTFISSHRLSLSSNPAMSSICHTTPGVTCLIRFEKDGVVKALPSKKTDTCGNVSWDWHLKDVGIATGDWTVVAVAKNGNKTVTSTDAIKLSVKP